MKSEINNTMNKDQKNTRQAEDVGTGAATGVAGTRTRSGLSLTRSTAGTGLTGAESES